MNTVEENTGKPAFDQAAYHRAWRKENAESLKAKKSTGGYTVDNVAVICTRCNFIKGTATLKELEQVTEYVKKRTKHERL